MHHTTVFQILTQKFWVALTGQQTELPSLKTEETRDRDRDISDLLDRESFTAETKGPGAIVHHLQQMAGRACWQSFRKEATSERELTSRLAPPPGKTAAGLLPHSPQLTTITRADVSLE